MSSIWKGFGTLWDGLGPHLGALGRLLVVFWTFKIQFFSDSGPRWVSGGLLNRFWVDLGKDWGGFLEHMGGFGEDFPLFWLPLGMFVQEAFEMIWGGF